MLFLACVLSHVLPSTPPPPSLTYRYAEGTPRQPLTPAARQLHDALLRGAPAGSPLAPAELSDLVDHLSRTRRDLALRLLHSHAAAGAVARSGSFASLLTRCRKAAELDECVALLATLHAAGLRANPTQYLSLLAALGRAGRLALLRQVYDAMAAAGARRSNQTHTVVLSALLRGGDVRAAAEIAAALLAADEYPRLDLPLRNTMLAALLRARELPAARRMLADVGAAGLTPCERTLNVVLHGLLLPGGGGALSDALEIFNEFTAAKGGSVETYNIMAAGFAREGQLVNAESVVAQLRQAGLRANAYTYNALLLAASEAAAPRRAREYLAMMRKDGLQPSAISLTLLAQALACDGSGVDAVTIAREESQRTMLDAGCCRALLHACAHSRAEQSAEALLAARWVWKYMARKLRIPPDSDSRALCSMLRCFGRATDFDGAREAFESAPRPRSPKVWEEMIRVCNACGQPEYALSIVSQSDEDGTTDVHTREESKETAALTSEGDS
ncbi:hypothetical protein AB1Y20_018814 [Prymnesium parvum]|uniref:Pentacotripeptide-repeat region of PRORP domain-containing protein n=1 Tax=Prymnesium parvum TaxID=97485 RepID=A0AB34JQT5_PRYPA